MSIDDIKLVSGGYNNACRYLHELVLVNDLNKSDLYQVSEKNSSVENSNSSKEIKLITSLSSLGIMANRWISSS